jgi:uncharacterized PurR-regulated membrane protein YhhQ (DUF165 family)
VVSTLAGEAADTAIFCTVAYLGVVSGGTFLNYVLVGYAYKCAVEIVMLPLTYRVIGFIRRRAELTDDGVT